MDTSVKIFIIFIIWLTHSIFKLLKGFESTQILLHPTSLITTFTQICSGNIRSDLLFELNNMIMLQNIFTYYVTTTLLNKQGYLNLSIKNSLHDYYNEYDYNQSDLIQTIYIQPQQKKLLIN